MSRPVRFLHVTTFYPPYSFGGDGLYVRSLAHALADRGHLVDVVHCVDSYRLLSSRGPGASLADHPHVAVHRLRSPFGWLSPLVSHQTGRPFFKAAALRRLVDRPIDVIHFHNVSLFGPGVLNLAGNRPVVKLYTTHEHWLVCPTHVLWKLKREPCDHPECLRCTIAARRPPQLWRHTGLLDRTTGAVDLFLAPSRFTIRMHADRGFKRPLTFLAPFTARSDEDWQRPRPRPHHRPYFLFVGRLEPVKGLDDLVHAWERVVDADLVIVGEGSLRARLEAAAIRNPRLVVRGALPPDRLGPYFVHSLGCVVPSVTYEVAPTVVLEAFARKTPVIGRDLGGTAELVRDSGGGVVFRTEDELLAAVRRFASDEELRRDLGERGYGMFLQRWTTEAHVARYLRMIEETARAKLGVVPWSGDAREPAPVTSEPILEPR